MIPPPPGPTHTLAATLATGPMATLAPYMGVFFVAFFASIIVTPICRRLAMRNGIVDWPDLKRKNHRLPAAYLGGVAIFVAWLLAVLSSYVMAPETVKIGLFDRRLEVVPVTVILGAGVITLTGLFDDIYGIRARVKVGGQLFAAAALTAQHMGHQVTQQAFGAIQLDPGASVVYFLATFFVAFLVLAGCNAVNLLDGLDGLAAGVVAIAMGAFLIVTLVAGDISNGGEMALREASLIVFCLASLGAILGFLPYNFNPATVFMGDAGSLLLGFLSVSAILMLGDVPAWSLKLTLAALIIFALPITDTSLAIIRRKLRGQPIFAPDCQHLHHLLRRSGMSVRQAVVTLYGVAGVFAVIGIALIASDLQLRYILAVFAVIYGFIMVTAFKYGSRCLALDRLREQERRLDAQRISEQAPIDRPESGSDDAALELPGLSDRPLNH